MLEAKGEARASARTPILFVLMPFALLFLICNYFRTVNAVLAPYLISGFHLSAAQLGLLISVYFLASALFQAPLGLMMDRFGPRRVQGSLIVVAGTGALIFALGPNWQTLLLGRAIMGIGAAGGLMTSLVAVTLWFPSTRWPFFNGVVLSIGGVGSLCATLPTQFLLNFTDWQKILIGVALASFLASVLMFAAVPEKPRPSKGETLGEQLKGMAVIYRDRLFWRFAPLYLATTGSTIAFQSLWAGPWLHDVVRLDANGVASHLLVLSLLLICSYFMVGWIATELGKRNIPLTRIVMVGSAVYILTLTPLTLPTGAGVWSVLLGIGLLSNINTLCYPILARHFPPGMTGRATTALNSFFFVGAFFVQFAIGLVIDLVPATVSGHYPVAAYQLAFAVMITLQISAWIWCLIPPKAPASPTTD